MKRLFIILLCVTSVSIAWSQKIKYRISNGLQIEGVNANSPIIYDNDMIEDTPEDQLLWLKYHYGEINLVGNIITRNMDRCNLGPCKYSMQQTIDQWNRVASGIKGAGYKMLSPVAGSSEMMTVPSSKKIEDTKWKASAGVDLIIREALKASKEKPLVIIIGGQATTVANAYLKNPSIADRIVVLHVNGYRDAPIARGFNTIDAWSAYVVMSNMRYINFTGDLYGWYKGKNVNLTQTMVNSLPNNYMANAVKSWYSRFFKVEVMADAPPLLYLFKPSLWKNVVRKLKNGQTTTSDNFDFLLVSENDWAAYGPTYIDLMKNAGSQQSKPPVSVASVKISPETVQLKNGATSQLSKNISPSNAANQNVTWTSSNTSVATVSSTGLVTAKSVGTAQVTVKSADGGKTAIATITVASTTVAVSAVSISPATVTLEVNATRDLVAQVTPSNATNKTVKWATSNASVAVVSSAGVVTAKSKGAATITGTTSDGNKVAKASVTVTDNSDKNLEDVPAGLIIDNATRGSGADQFNFSGTGWTHAVSAGDPYHDKTVSYSNTTGNSASVSFTGNRIELFAAKASHHGIMAVSIDNGPEAMVDLYSASRQNFALVYGSASLSQGVHTIKMRVTGNKNSAATGTYAILDYLQVFSGTTTEVTSVKISPASVTIGIDEKKQLSTSISPASAAKQSVTWTSSDNRVAVVNASGIVTGVGAGTATIMVKTADDNKTAAASVTVTSPSHAFDFDDSDRGTALNKFNFSGSGWKHGTSSSDPYLNQTVSFSNVTNDEVTVKFVGNKVQFYASKASHHGVVGVSVDNEPEQLVDLYASTRENFVMVFGSESLPQEEHTIKIRVTGKKNNASTDFYAIVDYIKVYSTATGGGAGASAMMSEEATQQMEYYPNPLRPGDVLHVNLPEVEGEVALLDLAGIPQMTFQVTDKALAIPTGGLYKGMYLLQYRTSKGREVVKIMVQ